MPDHWLLDSHLQRLIELNGVLGRDSLAFLISYRSWGGLIIIVQPRSSYVFSGDMVVEQWSWWIGYVGIVCPLLKGKKHRWWIVSCLLSCSPGLIRIGKSHKTLLPSRIRARIKVISGFEDERPRCLGLRLRPSVLLVSFGKSFDSMEKISSILIQKLRVPDRSPPLSSDSWWSGGAEKAVSQIGNAHWTIL